MGCQGDFSILKYAGSLQSLFCVGKTPCIPVESPHQSPFGLSKPNWSVEKLREPQDGGLVSPLALMCHGASGVKSPYMQSLTV